MIIELQMKIVDISFIAVFACDDRKTPNSYEDEGKKKTLVCKGLL